LGCCIYQIFKESGDGNKLSNNIAEFEDLYNVAAVGKRRVSGVVLGRYSKVESVMFGHRIIHFICIGPVNVKSSNIWHTD